MDPRDRFTDVVQDYEAYRPDYPSAFVEWVVAHCPGRRVVDVGSGTGILSRQLAAAGLRVIGVEPNDAMRAAAEARGGGPTYVAGDAERTGLETGAADLVVGAQAFHWFDLDRALPELERVAAGGAVVAVWNDRRTSGIDAGFTVAYDALLTQVSADFRSVPKPRGTTAALLRMRPDAAVHHVAHTQRLDREGVIGRAWSSSYVIHAVSDRPAFDAALAALVDQHAVDGMVTIAYRTGWVTWAAARSPGA